MALDRTVIRVVAQLPGWVQHPTWPTYQVGYICKCSFSSPLFNRIVGLSGQWLEPLGRSYSTGPFEADIWSDHFIDPSPYYLGEGEYWIPDSISGELHFQIYKVQREFGWYFLVDGFVCECSIPATVRHNTYVTIDLRPYLAPVTAEQSVSLGPGKSVVASFNVVAYQRKTYQVTVDGLSGSFIAR